MKILKRFIILSAMLANFYFINQSYADIIIVDDNLIIQDNVYLGKKKLDEEKLDTLTSQNVKNYIIDIFHNDKITFLNSYYKNQDANRFIYSYLYYSINLENNKNISGVKDFNGDDLIFETIINGENQELKIYFDSFYEEIYEEDGFLMGLNYKYKNSEYIFDEKEIFIEYDDNSNYNFLFRSNIPKLNFENTIYGNTIILNQESEVILNIENLNNNNINIQNYHWLDINYNTQENKIIVKLLNQPSYHTYFNISFYNGYDIHYEKLEIFNESSCNQDEEIYYSSEGEYFYLGRGGFRTDIYNLNINLIKNNGNGINEIDNFDYNLNGDHLVINPLSEGIYKLKLTGESYGEKICREVYGKEIETIFRENIDTNNKSIYYFKDNLWGEYVLIDKLFPDLNYEIDFRLDWKYNNYIDFIEKLDFNVKNIEGEIFYEGNRDCINNGSCTFEIEDLITEGLYEEIELEIKYKDIFNEEKTYKKKYYFEYGNNEELEIFSKGDEFTLGTIEFSDETNFNNLVFIDDEGNKLDSINPSEEEMIAIWDEVDQRLIEDGVDSFNDDIYTEYLEVALLENYGESIIYLLSSLQGSNNIFGELIIHNNYSKILSKIEYYLDDEKIGTVNVKDTLEEFNYEGLNLLSISKKYIQFSTNTISLEKIESTNDIKIEYKNNIIEDAIKIEGNLLNTNYYFNYGSGRIYNLINEEEIFSENIDKVLYYLDTNFSKIYIFVPIDSLYNLEKINYNYGDDNNNIEYNKYRIFDEKTNFNDLEESKTKIKSSENGTMGIYHNFIENIDGTIFVREINIYERFLSNIDINININGENLGEIDYSKIYVCNNYIDNIENIETNLGCFDLEYINFYGMSIVGPKVYIYGLNGLVNDDFERLNIEFNIKKMDEPELHV